jgi:hypothetical protein
MKYDNFSYEFVEYIPERIHDGVIYISIQFGTAIHNCACGCGREVVTPLSPADWTLIFDGVSISLTPSIGNWTFPCQSHYWIKNNEIKWAAKFSQMEINTVRANDTYLRNYYYKQIETKNIYNVKTMERKGLIKKIIAWFSSKLS